MTPADREKICRACEMYRAGLRKGACLLLRSDVGRVSTERLLRVIDGQEKCPQGRHDAARLLEGCS